jgi:hypothetical protein
MKVHRWQPTGRTPCGKRTDDIVTNMGYYLSDGVTCKACLRASTLVSLLGDAWNGQSDGIPKAETDEVVA